MYLSPISYQPMSVTRNMRQQNSAVNFKAGKLSVPVKLPADLAQERAACKQKIDKLRREIRDLRFNKASGEKIKALEKEVMGIINDFTRKLNDYVTLNNKSMNDYLGYYLC